MAKYVYPAVFEEEKAGGYSIYFPDLRGCYSQGDNIADGIAMAEDALALWMYRVEENGEEVKTATELDKIPRKKKDFVTYICADTSEYRKKFASKSVKKTLTIPGWLNYEAEAQGINFSKTLQRALEKEIARA